MIDLTVPQRQSPLAVVFLGLRTLRNIGLAQLAIIVVFVVRGPFGGPLLVLPALLFLALGAFSALAWWRYTFQLLDGELVVHKGVLRLDRLTVPVDRIQSLAIEQELLHRLTGLVKVSVDTAGSSEAEFTIDAIPRPVAEELERRAVTATSQATRTPSPGRHVTRDPHPERVVIHHDGRRLLAAALTASPLAGLVVLGPLLAALGQLGDDLPFDSVSVDSDDFTWWWLPAGLAAGLAFSVLLNIGRVILQDWDLTLRASDTSVRRTSGLLSRTSSASSVARVQVLRTARNPLQRAAGLQEVELSTIGEGDLWLVGCDDDQVDLVREAIHATPGAQLALDRRIHPAGIWLAVRNTTLLAALASVGLTLAFGWWAAPLPLLMVLWAGLTQTLHVRNHRWSIGAELATSSRVFSSSTRQSPLRKANSVKVSQSIFERRRGLATVKSSTAAGSITIGMIPLDEARAVRDVIVHAAETDRRPWM